jgi:lipopolysaccharide export system protein LptA
MPKVKNPLALVLLASLGWPLLLRAQPNAELPVYIKADAAELDERTGVFTYKGGVRIEQVIGTETVLLQADELILHSSNNGIDSIIASGQPVNYEEQHADLSVLQAVGQRFEYSQATQQIVVTGDARIERGGNLLSGERLVYDLQDQKVTVPGLAADPAAAGGKVKTLLLPTSELFEAIKDDEPQD